MVPGMVQDGSDMVPKRFDLTNTFYLQGFAMVPGVAQDGSGRVPKRLDFICTFVQKFVMASGLDQDGSGMAPQSLGARIRKKSFLFDRWRLFLKAAHTKYTNYIEK